MFKPYRKISICYWHSIRSADAKCNDCKKDICKYCVNLKNQKIYCPDCMENHRKDPISFF